MNTKCNIVAHFFFFFFYLQKELFITVCGHWIDSIIQTRNRQNIPTKNHNITISKNSHWGTLQVTNRLRMLINSTRKYQINKQISWNQPTNDWLNIQKNKNKIKTLTQELTKTFKVKHAYRDIILNGIAENR